MIPGRQILPYTAFYLFFSPFYRTIPLCQVPDVQISQMLRPFETGWVIAMITSTTLSEVKGIFKITFWSWIGSPAEILLPDHIVANIFCLRKKIGNCVYSGSEDKNPDQKEIPSSLVTQGYHWFHGIISKLTTSITHLWQQQSSHSSLSAFDLLLGWLRINQQHEDRFFFFIKEIFLKMYPSFSQELPFL